ncbi:hypothetical protein Tco_0579670, partial [Tanacetum coccineum]
KLIKNLQLNASLTQELKECKTNLDETSRALGEATSSRDSSLIALQTKQTELEKYTALNDLTKCRTCVVNSNHDACVSRYLKDVNARTKKPHVVPISASPVPQLFQKTFRSQQIKLGLMVMTFDHNRSELGIHDHSNEPSSSKLVPKVVPLAVKTATLRQELELLFHHHIAMLRTTGINPMIQPEPEDLPKDNPKLEIAVLRVILFSIHNDEWKSFQCHHQTALRSNGGDGNLNPIQMLNLQRQTI